jgi:hypothetical protein
MTQSFDLLKYEGLSELSSEQMLTIEGGGFWEDFAYLLGATAHSIWQFSKQASEYQHSLPANLKK